MARYPLLPAVNTNKTLLNQPVTTKYDVVANMDARVRNNPNPSSSSGETEEDSELQSSSGFYDKFLAVTGGIANLANSFQDLSEIADTSQQWDAINSVKNVGMNNYGSFEELQQDYGRMAGLQTNYDMKDVRGKSDGQLAMGVGNSMLQGASAGAAFGPWGAAAGAAVGLGAGLLGVMSGNSHARLEKMRLENGARMAEIDARDNLQAANENLGEYKFRSGVANRAAWGGRISRREQSVKRFADHVLHSKPRRASGTSGRIMRVHSEGGTMIRFKR